MKLESKLLVSLGKHADHVVPRRELAQLGSKSQLTQALNRLIATGRLMRLRPGVYAKTGRTASTDRSRKRRAAMSKLPNDLAHLPVRGVGPFVARLAKAHSVVYTRTRLDDFAEPSHVWPVTTSGWTRQASFSPRCARSPRNIEAEKDLAIVKAQEKVFFEAHLEDALAFLRRVRGPVTCAHFRKPLPGIPAMRPLGLMAPQEGMR